MLLYLFSFVILIIAFVHVYAIIDSALMGQSTCTTAFIETSQYLPKPCRHNEHMHEAARFKNIIEKMTK